MSIFSKIFRRRREVAKDEVRAHCPDAGCLGFSRELAELLSKDKFLAVSDYKYLIDWHKADFSKLKVLKETNMLSHYCAENGMALNHVETAISSFEDLSRLQDSKIIFEHNRAFLNTHLSSDRAYLDMILSDIDPAIKLDEEQREVVLSDEDYTLVIAGAGAGKTTTIAAKVKYLVERKGISPEQILVISFTNKAVGELKERINKGLKIDCPITTFHSTGYAILRKDSKEKRRIVDQGFMFNVINNYLKDTTLENPELVDKLILFFGSYFDAPYEGDSLNDFFNYIAKADFSTLKGNISEYNEEIIEKRTGRKISITHEFMRSAQEVRIANFLYMNGIEYSYEKPYPYGIIKSYKPYTPDFTIVQGAKTAFIEHFGITESGQNNRYSKEQLSFYKQTVNDKVILHRKHNTDLIYTFSAYDDGRDFLDHLKESLIAHGFELHPRPAREIFDKIVSTEENHYIMRLVNLVCTFIHNFKTNGYGLEKFEEFRSKTTNERNRLFLTICQQCFLEYSKRLKEKNAIDFEDMINDSAKTLRMLKEKGRRLDFKYIIVDEYQDISHQRFNLTKELGTVCDAKIVAVGDDWQSIYAFSGSDITLFTKFRDTFGYGQELKITRTYRNAQEVIDIAGGFIQKNSSQFRKALVSPKHIDNPVIIQTYTEEVDRKKYEGKGGKYFLIGETVSRLIREILDDNPKSSILLLGRYGFDGYNLTKSADFEYWEKTGRVTSKTFAQVNLEFMTVHRAKGLGYDNVIIINAIDSLYGFPSQIQDDPVLKYVVREDASFEYAEERRLFYVALTRTKNRVYIVTPQQRPSPFVRELVADYPEVTLRGTLDQRQNINGEVKHCPICGYPLQLRYKQHYGLKLWICANEPELCGFMTNNLRGGELGIMKCDCCRDGYLVVKEGQQGGDGKPFLGCTNYKSDRSGCNNYVNLTRYRNLMNNRNR